MKLFLSFLLLLPALTAGSQPAAAVLDSFVLFGDVVITIDRPANYKKGKATLIILYGLPNGSTTAHTMGRKWTSGDDHRYDIQHIRAQTVFLRKSLKEKNLVVCYLENNYHSWPLWKQRHPDAERLVQAIVDTLYNRFEATDKSLYLNGHSGGGRFIFTYLDSVKEIPSRIRSITFLDSNYGYDSTYTGKFVHWLSKNPGARLNVFAYNDSIALYNGKPLVSSKGGTWFKSHQMLHDLQEFFAFRHHSTDSLEIYQSTEGNISFYLKPNYDQGIYHTQQVELNGFIHSILLGTPKEEKGYKYYGKRAYTPFIQ